MIDIDKSIEAVERQRTFWVEFEVDGEAEKPSLEITVAQKQQRKILNRFIRASAGISSDTQTAQNIEIQIDYYGMAQELSDYAIKWKGFSGEFDKAKLKKWFEEFGKCAEAFAQNFKGLLEEYESAMMRRKDAEIKN